jgi:hypothetical protein
MGKNAFKIQFGLTFSLLLISWFRVRAPGGSLISNTSLAGIEVQFCVFSAIGCNRKVSFSVLDSICSAFCAISITPRTTTRLHNEIFANLNEKLFGRGRYHTIFLQRLIVFFVPTIAPYATSEAG